LHNSSLMNQIERLIQAHRPVTTRHDTLPQTF
jgi:hypothetical protein